jgi:type IV pilus assembly protein PilX
MNKNAMILHNPDRKQKVIQMKKSGLYGRRQGGRPREGGAILVVGLIMLVMITLLSLVAMQNTRQQVRMAGNALLHSQVFQKAETGLRHVENQVYDRRKPDASACVGGAGSEEYMYKVAEDLTVDAPGASNLFILDGWNKKRCSIDVQKAHGAGTYSPWYVIEQLPNTTSDMSARAQNKRDMEVFRVNVLASDTDPSVTDSKALVVILQSTILRH